MGNGQTTDRQCETFLNLHPQHAYVFQNRSALTEMPYTYDLEKDSCFPGIPTADQRRNGSCVMHAINVGLVCSHRRQGTDPHQIERLAAEDLFEHIFRHEGYEQKLNGISYESALRMLLCRLNAINGAKRLKVDIDNFKRCLIDGHVVLVGFQVSKEMEDWQNHKTKMSQSGYTFPVFVPGDSVTGTHAVALLGWDDRRQGFKIKNSWGSDWGHNGNCWFPYESVVQGCVKDAFFLQV